MWIYHQINGAIWHDDKFYGAGYSGNGAGKNDPDMEAVHDVGPIPRGAWTMTQWIDHDPLNGYGVIVLEPKPGTDTHGRAGFRWHGDKLSEPGTASHGCIVQGYTATRKAVWDSGDHDLTVV